MDSLQLVNISNQLFLQTGRKTNMMQSVLKGTYQFSKPTVIYFHGTYSDKHSNYVAQHVHVSYKRKGAKVKMGRKLIALKNGMLKISEMNKLKEQIIFTECLLPIGTGSFVFPFVTKKYKD